MAWELSIMEPRSWVRGCPVDEADGDGDEGAAVMILFRERISVSKRNRSPSNDFWVFYKCSWLNTNHNHPVYLYRKYVAHL